MSIQQVNGPGTGSGKVLFAERSTAKSSGSSIAAPDRVAPIKTPSPESRPATVVEVTDAVERINKMVQQTGKGIQFSVDDDTGHTVVKVVDTETKEVLRQFPSETAMAIAKTLDRAKGLLISQKV